MIIGISGPRAHKVKLGYHDGTNAFVQWRLKQMAKVYLRHYGATEVFTGMATGFDTAAAVACVELDTPFVACVPFEGQESRWSQEEKDKYNYLISKAARVEVLDSGEPAAWKYQKRNEYIVNNAELMLVLWNKDDPKSGTGNCVRYAYDVGVPITNLWEVWEARKDQRFPFSNFQKCVIEYKDMIFPSVENFFQAMKTKDDFIRQRFTMLTPVEARNYGKSVELREDWEDVKDEVMKFALNQKFHQNPYRQNLLETGDDELIEWNTWHDNEWGICYCNKCGAKGENKLGKLIMDIRGKL